MEFVLSTLKQFEDLDPPGLHVIYEYKAEDINTFSQYLKEDTATNNIMLMRRDLVRMPKVRRIKRNKYSVERDWLSTYTPAKVLS